MELVAFLGESGIELRSLREAIDTTTPPPASKLTFHVFAALAEMEAEDGVQELSTATSGFARRR